MKKLLLLFIALLTGVSGAWAETVTVSSSSGSFKRSHGNAAAQAWNNYWASTSDAPQITVITNYNGDAGSGNIFAPVSGKTKGDVTYTTDIRSGYGYSFFISGNYIITKITIQAWAQGGVNKITDNTSGKNCSFSSDEAKTIEIACNAQEVINAFNVQNNTALYANVIINYVPIVPVSTPFCIYGPTTGTFYSGTTNKTKQDTYADKWVSTQTSPQVTISVSGNNLTCPGRTSTEGASCFFAKDGKEYTISVPNNAKIKGYTIVGRSYTNTGSSGADISATTSESVSKTFTGSADAKLEVSDKDLRSTTFTLNSSSNSAFLRPTWFLIYAENDPTFVADKASISNTKSYMVHGALGDWQSTSADATSLSSTTVFNRTDDTRQIAFIKSATTGNYYAYSVITGKFITSSNTLSDTPEPLFIFETGNADYPFFFSFTDDKSDKNINLTSAPAFDFNTNNTYDEGNQWCLYAAKDFDIPSAAATAISDFETANVTATYNLVFNGNVIDYRILTLPVGTSTVSQWSAPTYCTISAADVATLTAETTEVNFTLNWTGPFDISSSYADATWYYVKLKGEYLVYSTTAPYHLYTQEEAVAAADNSLWAFVGDPYNGLRIINYAAGNGKYLNMSSTVQMAAGEYPSYSLCNIGQNTYGFTLENGTCYYRNDGSLLTYGNSDWRNTESAAFTLDAVNWKNVELAKLTLFASEQHMGDYFGVLESSITGTRNYVENGTIASSTRANYDDFVEYLNGTIALNVKKPGNGYYRFYNNTRNRYMGTENGTPMTLESATAASTIVKLVYDDDAKTYKIQMQGKELNAPVYNTVMTFAEIGSGAAFTAEGKAAIGAFKSGTYYVHPGAYNFGTPYALLGYTAPSSDAASGWVVEEATSVSIPLNYDGSAYSYGTMYLPFGVTLSGAKAYIMTVSGEWAIPSEIAEVPANTPVLIRAEGEVTSVTATINDAATAVTTGNQLAGTFVDITSDRVVGEYILGNGDAGIAFYQRKSGRKIGANKAYLNLGADLGSGAVKGIRWDFTDGINSLTSSSAASQKRIFNLAGQRMSKTAKGVNIVDGKKLLVK